MEQIKYIDKKGIVHVIDNADIRTVSHCNKVSTIGKSAKYKHVYLQRTTKITYYWLASILRNHQRMHKRYLDEREAAKAVDLFLISLNLKPVNVLCKKILNK